VLSCEGTVVGGALADAAPVIARETPAAPNAKAALPRFRLELRRACVMGASASALSTSLFEHKLLSNADVVFDIDQTGKRRK
jgi:hypothetical protein